MNSKFMTKLTRQILLKMLSRKGLEISRAGSGRRSDLIDFLVAFEQNGAKVRLDVAIKSTAQLFQDIFAISRFADMTPGFFIEAGATDGIFLSNTYLLESEMNWTGVLVEPGQSWWSSLELNRPNAIIDKRCLGSRTGEMLRFKETHNPEYSGNPDHFEPDGHFKQRSKGFGYAVESVSLNDLLAQHNAPETIQYLSLDTEGSEYEILKAVDFGRYRFEVITVEHNYSSNRGLIYELLISNGYERVLSNLSNWDDWFVLKQETQVNLSG